MTYRRLGYGLLLCALGAALAVVAAAPGGASSTGVTTQSGDGMLGGAGFAFDPYWPKPLPDNWTLGNVVGVAVDSRDHIWIVHRPGSLNQQERGADADPPLAECCRPAPPVIEFTQEGDVVQAWGGPSHDYEWPQSEHGIFIDHLDNVWLAGSGGNDSQILKFTRHGRFLLQIGAQGEGQGSNDLANFGQPAEVDVDPRDQRGLHRRRLRQPAGRRLRRRYRRVPPALGCLRQRPHRRRLLLRSGRTAFAAVRAAGPLRHAVGGRARLRLRPRERPHPGVPSGTAPSSTRCSSPRGPSISARHSDVDFSPDPEQRYLYNIDGMNQKVWIISREDLSIVDSFGFGGHRGGRLHRGAQPGRRFRRQHLRGRDARKASGSSAS